MIPSSQNLCSLSVASVVLTLDCKRCIMGNTLLSLKLYFRSHIRSFTISPLLCYLSCYCVHLADWVVSRQVAAFKDNALLQLLRQAKRKWQSHRLFITKCSQAAFQKKSVKSAYFMLRFLLTNKASLRHIGRWWIQAEELLLWFTPVWFCLVELALGSMLTL